MMKPTISGGQLLPSKEQVEAVEERLGITLPNAYRTFLLKINGGRPDPCSFDFKGADGYENSSVVRNFLSLSDKEEVSFELEYRYCKENNRIPRDVAPIAHDPGGNLICISLSGPDEGKIYFWDHELELEQHLHPNLAFLAKNFSDFLSMLHDEEA